MIDLLRKSLQLEEQDVYSVNGPLNIPDLMVLYDLPRSNLKDKPLLATVPETLRQGSAIFDAISIIAASPATQRP